VLHLWAFLRKPRHSTYVNLRKACRASYHAVFSLCRIKLACSNGGCGPERKNRFEVAAIASAIVGNAAKANDRLPQLEPADHPKWLTEEVYANQIQPPVGELHNFENRVSDGSFDSVRLGHPQGQTQTASNALARVGDTYRLQA
jgi:hypothetical protein